MLLPWCWELGIMLLPWGSVIMFLPCHSSSPATIHSMRQPREELGERHPMNASDSIADFSARRGGGEVARTGRELQCVGTRAPSRAGVASRANTCVRGCVLHDSSSDDCVLHARVRSLRLQAGTWSLAAGKDQRHH